MPKTQKKLIIIDGNALIHRSFHALPPTLRTKKGVLVNAVYGFTSFLLKALNEFRPEYVVLTLDMAGPTFRHEAYVDYKATRTKAPDELYEQIPLVKEMAKAFNIPIFELSGYEADDLIGTICAKTAGNKDIQKIIITGDMDTLQLVDDNTKVYSMSRGLSESVLYGKEEVKGRYGLTPAQIIDYKALRGDPSDNIPGVRGIGEKIACELVSAFNDLDGVYEAAERKDEKIKPRIVSLLLASQDNAYLSRRLATIDCRVPLDFSLADTRFSSFSLEMVVTLFQEMEFRSLLPKARELRDRLDHDKKEDYSTTREPADAPLSQKKDIKSNYYLVNDDKSFAAFLKSIKKQAGFAIATETNGSDTLRGQLIGIAFSWQAGEAYFIPSEANRLSDLKPLLEDGSYKKIGHNLKLAWRLLKRSGILLKGLDFDTMIAAYLIEPADRRYDLNSLAFAEFGRELAVITKGNGQATLGFDGPDLTSASRTAGEIADTSLRLSQIFGPKLAAARLDKVLKEIELPLIPVLGAMEECGIKVDASRLSELEEIAERKLNELTKDIYGLAGGEFNINSTKQLQEILFEKLTISTAGIKKTKTGYSTAEDELIKLQDSHPIISLIQDYRELSKLQSTYLQSLPKMIDQETGRIHTNFNQTVAATGRLSSADPNLQNIPVKTEEGQKVRTAFITDRGWELAAFDYSQIELRLAAHMSGDKKMISAFREGQDIHAATAAAINGVELSRVTAQMRREAKAVNFGIIYGQGPHGLSQGAGIPYAAAQDFIKKYFEAYPGVKKMMEKSIAQAKKDGYAVTLLGRRRPLPDLNSSLPMVRKAAERMAINTPLQGTAADMIKLAMIRIAADLSGEENEIRLLLQVHDELIFEVKKDKIKKYSGRIRKIMENTLALKIPIIVDRKTGADWGSLK